MGCMHQAPPLPFGLLSETPGLGTHLEPIPPAGCSSLLRSALSTSDSWKSICAAAAARHAGCSSLLSSFFCFCFGALWPKENTWDADLPQRFPHLEGFFFSPPHSGCTNRSGTRPDGAPRAESYLGGDYDFPAALTQRRRHPRGSHHPSAAPRASVSTPASRPLGMQQPTGSAGRCWRKHPRNDKWCRAVLYALYLTALSSFNLFYFSWKRVWGSSTRFSRDFSRSRSALTPPWRSGKQISFLVFVWKPGWKMISKLPKLETVLCFGGGGGERGGGEERSVSSHSNEERAQGARHCD